MRSRGTWAGDVGRTVDLETSIWSQISPIPSAPKLPAQSQINLKLEEKVESTCNGHAERSKRISCKICYEMLQKLVDLVSKMHLGPELARVNCTQRFRVTSDQLEIGK